MNGFERLVGNMSTIPAEREGYLAACRYYANDPAKFRSFRTDPSLRLIYEHASEEEGEQSLEFVRQHGDHERILSVSALNDAVGGPELVQYGDQKYSPSTLRYAAVAVDIQRRCNFLEGFDAASIIEIGGGYGGQCRVLCDLYEVGLYTLVDLLDPLALQKRYLDHFILSARLQFELLNTLESRTYDLVIANYSISEMHPWLQDVYIEKILRKATHGYIRYNHLPSNMKIPDSHLFAAKLPHETCVVQEEPCAHSGNRLIYW